MDLTRTSKHFFLWSATTAVLAVAAAAVAIVVAAAREILNDERDGH